MKDWLRKIGHWVVINNEIKSASPGDVGRLAYIKELLTSGEYDYRVATDKNGFINVKETELNAIPQDKLDRYLDIMKWSYAKYPGNEFKFKIHNKDYLNELLELEDVTGDKDWIPFSGLVNGDESEDEIMSEEKVKYVVDNVATFTNRGRELGEFIDQKQEAYGDSVSKTSKLIKVFLEDYLQEDGTYKISEELLNHILLQVRIIDKQNRIFSNPKADKMGESPYTDISGYGLLGERMQDK